MPKIKKLGDKATRRDYEEALEESIFNMLKSNLQEDGGKILSEIQSDMQEVADILLMPFGSSEELGKLSQSSDQAAKIVDELTKFTNEITGK